MSTKFLIAGVTLGALAVSACGNSPSKPPVKPWVWPTVTNADAGSDSGYAFPGYTNPGRDSGQTNSGNGGQTDGGNSSGGGLDGATGVDASNSLDASSTIDANAGDGGSTGSGDAGGKDAGSTGQDAGSTGHDAGSSGHDADGGQCGTAGLVGGNDCAHVVTCQDYQSGNKDVAENACDLSSHHCCIDSSGASVTTNSCTTSCSSGLKQAACDGPEDCSGGKVCCFNNGGTSCQTSCSFNANRLCHSNADCPSKAKCVQGIDYVIGTGYKWWGFCSG